MNDDLKGFPTFQYSFFVGGSREQYVIRSNSLEDFLKAKKELIEAVMPDEDPAWITEDNAVCPIHKVTMQHYEKEGEEWFSHKVGDKWCSGKDNKTNRAL